MRTLKIKCDIKERRKQVASLLSRSVTEREIAEQLGVDRSTINRDIKVLKLEAQQFVYDLARQDLAYHYKQCLQSIEESKREAWKIYNNETIADREKLLALRLIIQAAETRFKLLSEGPGLLAIKSLEDRLNRIEGGGPDRKVNYR
jgi:biotin operon repressor